MRERDEAQSHLEILARLLERNDYRSAYLAALTGYRASGADLGSHHARDLCHNDAVQALAAFEARAKERP